MYQMPNGQTKDFLLFRVKKIYFLKNLTGKKETLVESYQSKINHKSLLVHEHMISIILQLKLWVRIAYSILSKSVSLCRPVHVL